MHKVVYRNAFLLMVLFTSLGFAASFPPDQEKQIRSIIEEHYSAWNQHDPKKMADLYASDGELQGLSTLWGRNRSEVEKIYADEQNTKMKNAHIAHDIKSIMMIKPDIAFVDVETDIK